MVSEAPDENNHKLDLNVVLIDHYDSFTYNLVDQLSQICVRPPVVLAADAADSWEELLEVSGLESHEVDAIVLSPGPGNPEMDGKLGVSIISENPELPILGVCLGHQIMGYTYGASVERSPEPIHGQVRELRRLDVDDPLWTGVGTTINVTRYHSLHVINTADTPLVPSSTCLSNDGMVALVMSMKHKEFPHYGVQFHPESIGTPLGIELIRNFCSLAADLSPKKVTFKSDCIPASASPRKLDLDASQTVFVHELNCIKGVDPVSLMAEIYNASKYCFWLDGDQRMNPDATVQSRISVLGSSSHRVEYWGKEKPPEIQGVYESCAETFTKTHDDDIFQYLESRHGLSTGKAILVHLDDESVQLTEWSEMDLQEKLPFHFRGGHVGFLGYEARLDTSRYLEMEEQGRHQASISSEMDSNPFVPTAAFLHADRSFVYDHQNDQWYLIGVANNDTETSKDETIDWIREASAQLRRIALSESNKHPIQVNLRMDDTDTGRLAFLASQTKEEYEKSFNECMANIWDGNSYELCLTNQFESIVNKRSSFDLYRTLRYHNPAPYSNFLYWNPDGHTGAFPKAAFSIASSSPERFISVQPKSDGFIAEAKPIKGTVARIQPADGIRLSDKEKEIDTAQATELQRSIKNRAENLMIVDLLRNDLSRVCKAGSVHVSNLMDIESFSTVHQMVSTIRGEMTNSTPVDLLKASFPGGSMTGAPKQRTMEILNKVEGGLCRGPYSGSLGYISYNGCMDMNIIIRTAIVTPIENDKDHWRVTIGAGGALTAMSEVNDEYDEMLLKSAAVRDAVSIWSSRSEESREIDVPSMDSSQPNSTQALTR